MEIKIDSDVLNTLVQRKGARSITYNEVLRELLGLKSTDEPENKVVNFSDWLNDLPLENPGLYMRWVKFFTINTDRYIIDLYCEVDPNFKRNERNYRLASVWNDFMAKVLDKYENKKDDRDDKNSKEKSTTTDTQA